MTYQIEDKQQYLRGNLQNKLIRCKQATATNPSFTREVEIIEQALLTQRVPLSHVSFRLGSPWIPLEYYEQFSLEVFNVEAKFYYSSTSNTWDIRVLSPFADKQEYNIEYGFTRKDAVEAISKSSQAEQEIFNAISPWICDTFLALPQSGRGLIQHILDLNQPTIKVWKHDEKETKRENETLTSIAIAKMERLNERFVEWLVAHPDADDLEDLYNEKFNSFLAPDWTGAAKLGGNYDLIRSLFRSIGMAPEWADRLRDYQLDGIWRFAQEPGLLAFDVGLGKTSTSIAAAMLRRHWGYCSRAMFVVQKSTLTCFADDFKNIFPKARVLVADSAATSEKIRQNFLTNVCYGRWDAIIISHDSFQAIPVSRETSIAFIREALGIYESELQNLEAMGEKSNYGKGNKRRGNRVAKKLERKRTKLRSQLESLRSSRDTGITWELLGIDYLVVDEVQRFKNNLAETTLDNIPGVSATQSGRAADLEIKLQELRQRCGGNSHLLLTGTPEPTNSIVGIYCFMRYMLLDELKDIGCAHFDAWATQFSEIVYDREPKMDGSFVAVPRLRRFVNMAELWELYRSRVHRVTANDVRDQLSLPTAEYKQVSCPLSPAQQEIVADLESRYQRLREYMSWLCGGGQSVPPPPPQMWIWQDEDGYAAQWVYQNSSDSKPKLARILHPITKELLKADRLQVYVKITSDGTKCTISVLDERNVIDSEASNALMASKIDVRVVRDNYLTIYNDLRKVGVAPQLIDPNIPIHPTEKVVQAADNIAGIYHKTRDIKATQLVFCDMGTPGGAAKFPFYEKLRELCVERGIPVEQFAFIHEHNRNTEVREQLFDKVRSGEVAVLMGSTEPMGVGVNVQDRVIAMHKIDVPYRPDEDEQREGRGVRQGNMHPIVEVYQYLSEGTRGQFGADTMQFNLLSVKAQLRDRFWKGDRETRTIEEDSSSADLYLMFMAESSGNDRFLQQVKLEDELKKAKVRASMLRSSLRRLQHEPKADRSPSVGSLALYEKNLVQAKYNLAACRRDSEMVRSNLPPKNCFRFTLYEFEELKEYEIGFNQCYEFVDRRTGVTEGRKEFKAALELRMDRIQKQCDRDYNGRNVTSVGNFCGLDVQIHTVRLSGFNQQNGGYESYIFLIGDSDHFQVPFYSDPLQLTKAFTRVVKRIEAEDGSASVIKAEEELQKALEERERLSQKLESEQSKIQDISDRLISLTSENTFSEE